MSVTIDTNILVRAVSDDDSVQSPLARKLLAEASVAVVPALSLCEFDWVMRRHYRYARRDMLTALGRILEAPNVVVDRDVVDLGMAFLAAGGDFADGVIAYDGRRLGGEAFASFDVKAKEIAAAAGFAVV